MRASGPIEPYAVHPVLIVMPLGLFGIAVVFDIIGMLGSASVWGAAASWNIAGGITSGLIAALGFAREIRVTPLRARSRLSRIARLLVWGAVLVLFAQSLALRALRSPEPPPSTAIALSILALLLAILAGALGELSDRQARV